jgi:hypothetical protein
METSSIISLIMLGIVALVVMVLVLVLVWARSPAADLAQALSAADATYYRVPDDAPVSSAGVVPATVESVAVNRSLFRDLAVTAQGAAWYSQLWRKAVFPVAHQASTGYLGSDHTGGDGGGGVPWTMDGSAVLPQSVVNGIKQGEVNVHDAVLAWARTQSGGADYLLKSGVRGLELPLYYSVARGRMELQARGPYGRILIQKPAREVVVEVKAYLSENPREVVALIFPEVDVESTGGAPSVATVTAAFLDVLADELGDLLMRRTMLADLSTATVADMVQTPLNVMPGRVVVYCDVPELPDAYLDMTRGVYPHQTVAPQDGTRCTVERTLLCRSWQTVMENYLRCYAYGGFPGPFYLAAHVQGTVPLMTEASTGDTLESVTRPLNTKVLEFLRDLTGTGRDDAVSQGMVQLNGVAMNFCHEQMAPTFLAANLAQLVRDNLA